MNTILYIKQEATDRWIISNAMGDYVAQTRTELAAKMAISAAHKALEAVIQAEKEVYR